MAETCIHTLPGIGTYPGEDFARYLELFTDFQMAGEPSGLFLGCLADKGGYLEGFTVRSKNKTKEKQLVHE